MRLRILNLTTVSDLRNPPNWVSYMVKAVYYQISLHTELCVSTQTLMVNNSGKDDLFELFFAAIKCV